MRNSIKELIAAVLSICIMLSSVEVMSAKEIFSTGTNDAINGAIEEYGWEKEKMEAYSWIGLDGENYTRMYAYEKDMYKDTVFVQEKLAIDYGLLNPNDLKSGLLGSGGGSLVAVALHEAEAEDNAEVPLGSNHCKYTEWYGIGNVAWCAIFVVWCANECGYIDSGLFPRTASCDGLYSYFVDTGFNDYSVRNCTQLGGNEYTAVPGDIVFYRNQGQRDQANRSNRFGHVGIVTAVGDGFLDVTQGNTYDKVTTVRTSIFDLGTQIVHVEYPSGTDAIFNYLTKNIGFNAAAACGFMGNMEAESNCVSYRLQNDFGWPDYPNSQNYTEQVDSGAISEHSFVYNGPGGGGYGLCQWTSYNRKQNLYSLAKYGSVEYSIGDAMIQLQHLQYELENEYPYVLNALLAVPDSAYGVCTASDVVLTQFEKPQVLAYSERQRNSLEFWNIYGGSD